MTQAIQLGANSVALNAPNSINSPVGLTLAAIQQLVNTQVGRSQLAALTLFALLLPMGIQLPLAAHATVGILCRALIILMSELVRPGGIFHLVNMLWSSVPLNGISKPWRLSLIFKSGNAMPNYCRSSMRSTLNKLNDAELADEVLRTVLSIKPLKTMQKQVTNREKAASRADITLGFEKRCSPDHRCGCLACDMCRRRETLMHMAEYTPLLDEYLKLTAKNGDVSAWAATIIPPDGRVPLGQLGETDLVNFRDRERRRLRNSLPARAVVLGCMDVSGNTFRGIRGDPHFQVHTHSVILNVEDGFQESLKAVLTKRGDTTLRPLLAKPLVEPAGQLAYQGKADILGRESYRDHKDRRNTRDVAIPLAQQFELAQWLSQYRAEQRFFTIGDIHALLSSLKKKSSIKTSS